MDERAFDPDLAGAIGTRVARVRLIDRGAEKQALSGVMDSVRQGMSGALVLRGEPGVGKSALLGYAVELAGDMQVVRTVAVESEKNLGFAAVHQLLVPFLPAVERLPDPQRRALRVAFGLESGPPADPFLVGLAVLTLLSDAAETRPVLCVIDDAQWLDEESADLLSFVARRLLADRCRPALRRPGDRRTTSRCLQALPELRISRPARAGGVRAAQDVDQPADRPAGGDPDRGGDRGQPARGRGGGRRADPRPAGRPSPLPEPLPVGHRLEASFLRRVRELPPDTQTLLVLAAAGSPGQGHLMWQAAADLGIPESAAAPAEAAGLVTFWPQVRFRHSLVRSAVYHGATAAERRLAHRALASASDPELDAVSRAWHLAAAAARRDEGVAAELEAAAEHTRSRGGYAATAVLLERAAQLTPGAEARAERQLAAAQAHVLAGTIDRADALLVESTSGLRRPLSVALATRLRGRIEATCGQVADAVTHLVDAADGSVPWMRGPRGTRCCRPSSPPRSPAGPRPRCPCRRSRAAPST